MTNVVVSKRRESEETWKSFGKEQLRNVVGIGDNSVMIGGNAEEASHDEFGD
jgi:hypothetical protein